MIQLSDELLARIVALAADAIICVDTQQRITFFNNGASRIFGYTEADVLGEPLSLLIPERFHHAHASHVSAFGQSAVSSRQMGDRSLIAGRRRNGEEFPAEAAIAHLMSADGPLFSVVLRDVTAKRRIDDLNQQLLADTTAAVRARDELLGVVSHDLRNPVNAVKMLANAIVRRTADPDNATFHPEVLAHASVMLEAAEQMDALIQDLLDVTRLESGQLQLNVGLVALHDVVAAATSILAPLATKRGVTVVNAVSATLPKVEGDADRLVQVMSNLVSNAIKFSPPQSEVSISAFVDAMRIVLEITDHGDGIAMEDLPFVFDRFWQSRRTNRSGAGLGLAIALGIVRAHGGEINIQSELGKGTTVRFTLREQLA